MERRGAWREAHKSSKKSISRSPVQPISLPFHGFSRSKNTNPDQNLMRLAMRTERYGQYGQRKMVKQEDEKVRKNKHSVQETRKKYYTLLGEEDYNPYSKLTFERLRQQLEVLINSQDQDRQQEIKKILDQISQRCTEGTPNQRTMQNSGMSQRVDKPIQGQDKENTFSLSRELQQKKRQNIDLLQISNTSMLPKVIERSIILQKLNIYSADNCQSLALLMSLGDLRIQDAQKWISSMIVGQFKTFESEGQH